MRLDERAAVGIRLKPAAAIVRQSAPNRATMVLQFFATGMVAAGEIDLVGQDDEAWRATGKLGADDNEGLLTHRHAGARDAVGQQRERVSAI